MLPTSLPRVLAAERGTLRSGLGLVVAALSHALLAAAALRQEPPAPALVEVTEIELAPPARPLDPEPSIEPAATPPAPAPAGAASRAERRVRAPRSTRAEPAARAAKVRAVEEPARASEEPVRFVTDASGRSFGYGGVASGGTAPASRGVRPEPAGPTASGKGQPSLSRPPGLAQSDPCRGFFPRRARVDRGEVALRIAVEADGRVRAVTVVREEPSGSGFGFAARDCLLSKRLTPALDAAGRAVAVVSPVTVRFSR